MTRGANKEWRHLAGRHLRVWILVWGSTSASLSTADMSQPLLVRALLSRLRERIIHLSRPPQQMLSLINLEGDGHEEGSHPDRRCMLMGANAASMLGCAAYLSSLSTSFSLMQLAMMKAEAT